ncbi:MAG: phosphatidate cytidylyltransferase [Actinomycetaceae bacterium]|nr:phosphatidate cytidylyltransferase [Actinomycetaceae bacterium]
MNFSSFIDRLRPHPPAPPVKSTSRAGRDLWKAVPVGLVLLSLVALSLVWNTVVFAFLVLFVLLYALWEVTGAFLVREIRLPLFPLLCGTGAMVYAVWNFDFMHTFVMYLVSALTAFIWTFFYDNIRVFWHRLAGIFVLTWISFFGIFSLLLLHLPQGIGWIAALVLLPAASDTGGWLAGVLFGKHPMAPRISPKKTWEGLAGSLALAILLAFIVLVWSMHYSWYWAPLVGILATIIGTSGDLAESSLKRWLGVKDMGSIFPGHGGMLDRIDSIVLWAPALYCVAYFFLI